MLLKQEEITQCLTLAKEAFPRLANWEYNNEVDESYPGFALWAEYVHESEDPFRCFFITFTAFESSWTGTLTIGQPSYFWSSVDAGDADLLDTAPCATLQEAIGLLKHQIEELLTVFLCPHDGRSMKGKGSEGVPRKKRPSNRKNGKT